MKKATARPAIGIWTERVSTRTKLSSSHKMFIANRDGWRVCRMRNSMHDSQQKAAEYHNLAAHAHRTAAVHQGQEDHLTGHEHSRQALEHSNTAYQHSLGMHQKAMTDHIVTMRAQEAREEDIPVLAYKLWQARGCQRGHRRKIGSVRSKNWNLAISRDGPYDIADTGYGWADIALYISIP